jgi:3',5'-cyclic AMP phosphodiesterase CpdA
LDFAMTDGITFIQITDLHIGHAVHPDPSLRIDSSANLELALETLAKVQPKPKFIIVSGDLVDRGDVESYQWLKRRLDKLEMPVFYALGNHDDRDGFYRGVLGRARGGTEPYFYGTAVEGIHLLVLDSSTPESLSGTIEPEQFAWLEEELERHPELPKLIVSHHPPAIASAPEFLPWRRIAFAQSQRLGDLLSGRNVLGILSGHIHYDSVSIWNGIPVFVSTGLHNAMDVLFPEGTRIVRGASFCLGSLNPSGLTIAFCPLPSDRTELRLILDRDR